VKYGRLARQDQIRAQPHLDRRFRGHEFGSQNGSVFGRRGVYSRNGQTPAFTVDEATPINQRALRCNCAVHNGAASGKFHRSTRFCAPFRNRVLPRAFAPGAQPLPVGIMGYVCADRRVDRVQQTSIGIALGGRGEGNYCRPNTWPRMTSALQIQPIGGHL